MGMQETALSMVLQMLVTSGKLKPEDVQQRFNEFGEVIKQVAALCKEVEESRDVIAAVHRAIANGGGFKDVDGRTDQDGSGSGGGGGCLRIGRDGA